MGERAETSQGAVVPGQAAGASSFLLLGQESVPIPQNHQGPMALQQGQNAFVISLCRRR